MAKGYESRQDILKCIMNGSIPDVGFKYDKEQRFFDLEYIPAEITDELRKSTLPKDIQTCMHAGVLPDCYKGSTITVELQKKSVISCFIRHEDGTVTCPVGRQLFRHRDWPTGTVYGSREACRTCPNRCTDSKNTKNVSIGYNTNVVFTHMYGISNVPLQQPPPGAVPHNSFNRKTAEARVRLTIRRDPDLMQKRKEVIEHPFGTIKWYDGAHYLMSWRIPQKRMAKNLSPSPRKVRRSCMIRRRVTSIICGTQECTAWAEPSQSAWSGFPIS